MLRLSKSVWANGPLKAFLFSQSFSLWGNWFQSIALAAWLYQETGSTIWLGGLASGQQLVLMVFSPLAGHAAKTVGVKAMCARAQVVGALFSAIFALLAFSGELTPALAVGIAWMLSLSGAIEGACRQPFLLSLVGGADPHEAVGLDAIIYNLAKIIGPVIAAIAYARSGLGWCFAINCLSFVVAYVVVRRTEGLGDSATPVAEPTGPGVWGAMALLGARADMRKIMLVYAITGFCVSPHISIFPAFQSLRFPENAASLGWLYSAGGAGGLVASMAMSSVSRSCRPVLLALGCVFVVVGMAGLAISEAMPVALFFAALISVGGAFCFSTMQVLLLSAVIGPQRALASGLSLSAYYGAYMLGALALGAGAQRYGITASYLCVAGVFLIGMALSGKPIMKIARAHLH